MRLSPARIGMSLLLGEAGPWFSTGDFEEDIRRGREILLLVAGGRDLGFDPPAWHEYLAAMTNPNWVAGWESLRDGPSASPDGRVSE